MFNQTTKTDFTQSSDISKKIVETTTSLARGLYGSGTVSKINTINVFHAIDTLKTNGVPIQLLKKLRRTLQEVENQLQMAGMYADNG
jgi:hypothetical protein